MWAEGLQHKLSPYLLSRPSLPCPQFDVACDQLISTYIVGGEKKHKKWAREELGLETRPSLQETLQAGWQKAAAESGTQGYTEEGERRAGHLTGHPVDRLGLQVAGHWAHQGSGRHPLPPAHQ